MKNVTYDSEADAAYIYLAENKKQLKQLFNLFSLAA